MKNTIKTQMKDLQVGDIVLVRYAEQTVFAKIDSITEDFQKNGVRYISLWRSEEEVKLGKSKGIWSAKENTFIQKQISDYELDHKLSKSISKIVFNNQGA
jgi:DNA/RNA endonuclease YhcR with UshA esterase domain